MPSTALTLDNDYQFPPAPARAVLDRTTWNGAMADIAARMRAVLAKGTALDDLVADISFNAQTRLDQAITPLIGEVQADIVVLAQQVAQTLASNQQIIDDFQQVTAVNLEELVGKITEVEQRITTILAGGIDAADVETSADRQFVTLEQKALVVQLMEGFDGGSL